MKKSLIILGVLFNLQFGFAFQENQEVTIQVVPVSENISMLVGQGGNIGILTGEDGVIMIDDQFARLSDKIMATIETLSDQPVKFLVNTHFHGDHTGGNANFQEKGALIVAHENVRKRLKQNDNNPLGEGLPVVTFTEDVMLHVNNNDVMITHVHNAHTDGDALIYFPTANVLHTGDTFFNGNFPYIDLKSGGSVAGLIEAAEKGLMMINKDTRIIPGHGDLASMEDYKNYLAMLKGIQKNVQAAIEKGKSKEQIIADESITSEFYKDALVEKSFINGPKIRETFYTSLTSKTTSPHSRN